MELEIGKTYKVRHQRKGVFLATVCAVSGEWVTLEVVEGHTETLIGANSKSEGERLDVRRSLCDFQPRPERAE